MKLLNLSLILLLSSSAAFAMQQGSATQLQQKKTELAQLVSNGTTTLQSIATSGAISNDDATKLDNIATQVTTGATDLEALIADVKGTVASNANDPEAEKIVEDAVGVLGDVLKDVGPLALNIFEQIAAAKQKNHPVSRFHASVADLKTKVAAHAKK